MRVHARRVLRSLWRASLARPGNTRPCALTHKRKHKVRVPKEETALVSDLRYGWRKLRKLATDVSDNLARLQARGWGQAPSVMRALGCRVSAVPPRAPGRMEVG